MKRMKSGAALIASLLASSAAFAGDSSKESPVTNGTERIVVEASRLGETSLEMPCSVQVITHADIAKSGARDVVDLLEKSTSSLAFNHMGGGNPALAQVSMRGYGENGFGRLLVLVDGERVNNPDMNTPNLSQIDLASVRRIEILQGSQNVLHGDAASSGMINIVTESDDYDTHGKVELHGGSWDTIGGSVGIRGGSKETLTRYWANGGWDRSGGYRAHSAYDIWNANGGVKQNFANGSYMKISAFYNDSDYELPGYLSRTMWYSAPRSSTSEGDRYRRTLYGMNFTAYGIIDDDNSVRLTSTFSKRHMQSKSVWNHSPSYLDYDMYSYQFTPEWINSSKLGIFDNDFILGATYRYDRNHALSKGTGYRSKYEQYRQTMGFFAQDVFHVTDEVALQAGGRYERAWNEYTLNNRPRRDNDMVAYDVALLYNPIDGLKTYVKFSQFYRLPFLDEAPYSGYGRPDLVSPEHGIRADVGVDWTFLDDFNVAGNVYASRTKNEIFLNPNYAYVYNAWYGYSYWTGENVNSPSPVQREGFDLRASWEKDKVAGVALSYSFTDAQFDGGQYDGNDVPMVAASVATVNGRVWLWDDCFVFGGYRYQSDCRSISDFNNSYPRLPAYGVFNAGVQYAPSFAFLEGFKFGFTVDNLFNRNYCDYSTYGSYYYPAAGRSYMFTASYEF